MTRAYVRDAKEADKLCRWLDQAEKSDKDKTEQKKLAKYLEEMLGSKKIKLSPGQANKVLDTVRDLTD